MIPQIAASLFTFLADESERHVKRTINGVRLLAQDEFSTFKPVPSGIVARDRLLTLHRYVSRRRNPALIPVLLVPPLMSKPDILDLRSDASLVRALLERGYDVFLADFGTPESTDRHVGVDGYVERVHRSVREVKHLTGHRELSLVGYCMGGIFTNIFAALFPEEGVRNLLTIGTPTNFVHFSRFQGMIRMAHPTMVELAETQGVIPAKVIRMGFDLTQPTKVVTRPFKLLWNLWDESFIAAHQSVGRWMNEFLPLTQAAFRHIWTNLMADNELYEGRFEVLGKRVDLGRIRAACCAIAGGTDHLVPADAVEAVMDLLTVDDKTFTVVPGGHLGMLVGDRRAELWTKTGEWLDVRSRIETTRAQLARRVLNVARRTKRARAAGQEAFRTGHADLALVSPPVKSGVEADLGRAAHS